MRNIFIFAFVLCFTLCASFSAKAQQSADLRWEVLDTNERILIDRLAAEFFEDTLRASQANAIEDHTADLYRSLDDGERSRFRDARRSAFRAMSERERAALRGVKRPTYRNLAEQQKTPFRRHSLDQMNAAGAIDRGAMARALGSDV